ncbi:hypothetical protein V496_00322 [Pseudogymnoascus sp. VKM F-4515 (FW-2607)]|nr:hypothetical protein V496_00322 [Pseudogymnoascus sp. VKM F-4515 (FW-2607)]KFY98850.1 hypothetical protein V498_01178 [Pseudogymnoascus sp. VKM F-4517 (FW-2822)]
MPSYVIVGASRGLGYEWLRFLSQDPANTVVGLARTPGPVEAQLEADKITNVRIVKADMADHKSLALAASEVSKVTNNSLDHLIVNGVYANAEESFMTPTEFIGQEDLLRREFVNNVDVNVVGVIYSINAFISLIRNGNAKKVTVISTGLADLELAQKTTIAFSVLYSATKAALNIVVAKYAAELRGEGIIFLALSPGVVNTATAPPLPEHIPRMQEMGAEFSRIYPHFSGPISPAESVPLQKNVIDNMTIENSGAFLSHLGSKEWL